MDWSTIGQLLVDWRTSTAASEQEYQAAAGEKKSTSTGAGEKEY